MREPIETEDRRPNTSAAQLRFFQATTFLLVVLLLGGAGYYEYRQHQSQPVTILVDGAPAATVNSMQDAKDLIRLVHTQEVGAIYLQSDHPRFKEDVEFQRSSGDATIDSLDAAANKLSAVTHTVVDADVIIVDHKVLVGLPDAATAQAAVDELRNHYASMPPNDPVDEKPSFVQLVTIDRQTVPAKLAKATADDAAALLWTPPSPRTYTVLPRETGWLIAHKFHLSFSDFLRANAASDVNRLSPGDTVVVSQTFPPIDVIVKKREQENETFFGGGVRQLTIESTYIDGVLTGAPVALSMITLKRATPQATLD